MRAEILMAKEYMKRLKITDLKLALACIKPQISFARMGAEIGVGGSKPVKPELESCLAIQRGIKLLTEQERSRLPKNGSKVPMPKVKPAKGSQPKKLFYTTAPGSRAEWEKLPGQVQEQCCRCRHVLAEDEERDKKEREPGIWTELCPRCGSAEYYQFKYEVTA